MSTLKQKESGFQDVVCLYLGMKQKLFNRLGQNLGAMMAVPLSSRYVAVTPTEKEVIEEVNDVIHHLEKRQMPDMGMMKDLAPKMSQQMSAMAEAGVQPEAVSNGAKTFMKMGTSAMDMFKNMQGWISH
uniref:Uncharacterized protein n=1 Tax=Timema monikensis TaxID=170555 RepID=A0A7R9HTT0_9NEOP|nr:unnamed protein product [Timema monikensis]